MEHDARGALPEPASSLREIARGPFLRVTAANFFFFLCFATFFLLPKHLHALGAGKDHIGDVMAVFGLAATPLTPLVGSLVDRYKRRPFFLAGAGIMWAASTGFAFVHTLSPMLYVLRILQGVAFACAFTSATTLAADLAPPARRAQALGLFGVFTLITHGLGVTVAEQIEIRWGFTALFFIGSAFALVAGWLFLGTPETGQHHGGAKTASLVSIASSPAIFPSVVVSLVAGSGFGTALTFVPVLGEALRIGPVSIFFVSYMAAAVLVRVAGGRLADVFGRRAVAIPSLAVFALALIALGRVGSTHGLALVGLAFGAGHGLLYPALNALVVDGTRVENRGKAMSLYNAAFNAGVTGGNIVFGRVAEAYGYDKMFAVVGLSVIGVLIFFWRKSVPGT
jgi:MFS family permease